MTTQEKSIQQRANESYASFASSWEYAINLAQDDAPENDLDSDTLTLPDGTEYPGRLRYDDNDQPIVTEATCGECGFQWNDALITSITPTPGARCPNEGLHGEPQTREEAYDRLQEDPLSFQALTKDYQHESVTWEILLSTGGPASRILVTTDYNGRIESTDYQFQDWFEPWTSATNQDEDLVQRYAEIVGYYEEMPS